MLFADLPEEILWHILTTYFERDPQTLVLVASLSKRFHRITTPILYSHVRLGLDDADESRKVSGSLAYRVVQMLTLLGAAVRHVRILQSLPSAVRTIA